MKTAIDQATRFFHMCFVCVITCFVACTGAGACFNQTLTMLFENVPADIDAPVIVEATIYDFKRVSDPAGRPWTIMEASIDRVIKGPLLAGPLTIVENPTACTHDGVGRGIILGTLRDDTQYGRVLDVSHYQRSDPLKWSKEFAQTQADMWSALTSRK